MASAREGNDMKRSALWQEIENEKSPVFKLEDEEEDWDDVEPDEEDQQFLCLFEDANFSDMQSFLDHCRQTHNMDLAGACTHMALDFYDKIKLVNFIRSEVMSGNPPSAIPDKSVFQDEKYLQPVLKDDPILYNLEDLAEDHVQSDDGDRSKNTQEITAPLRARIVELEEEVQRLQSQFTDFRLAVKSVLDERLEAQAAELQSSSSADAEADRRSEADSSYFKSYSFHEIHETMLKDAVRTDAYRDFIYDNKHLFRDKIVLDVGCGTGILSMFCAKAGAKQVFAVDNSEIINKARQNIFENGLENVITSMKGKIEEVILPVEKVDIIVSEWMGYCLLYEAMLDSVIWARDRYLAADGLMVPSHITLHLAPLADPDYIASHISYWHSVYGFSMSSMQANIYDDVLIQQVPPNNLASSPATFLRLPLHKVTKEDLNFSMPFEVTLSKDIDNLDGWVLWFDTLFATSRDVVLPGSVSSPDTQSQAEDQSSNRVQNIEQNKDQIPVSFTTGPHGPETHWKQAVVLIDHGEAKSHPLSAGQKITGTIDYRKPKKDSRDLDIEVAWQSNGAVDGVSGEYKKLAGREEGKILDETPREEDTQDVKNEKEIEAEGEGLMKQPSAAVDGSVVETQAPQGEEKGEGRGTEQRQKKQLWFMR